MKFDKKQSIEGGHAEVEQVLRNFRDSVHAWSEAEFGRTRSIVPQTLHHTWRRAAAWALGCVLAIGGLSAGLYENYHQNETAKSAPMHRSMQQQAKATVAPSEVSGETARTGKEVRPQAAPANLSDSDAGLMAQVDSDVSRQVPSAMEPLAQLMESSSSQ